MIKYSILVSHLDSRRLEVKQMLSRRARVLSHDKTLLPTNPSPPQKAASGLNIPVNRFGSRLLASCGLRRATQSPSKHFRKMDDYQT